MSDNKVDNEEYQFPNDEDQDKYSMSPVGGTENIFSLFRNKKLMRSFGLILVFYLLMQLAAHFFVKDSEDLEEKNVKIEPVVTQELVQAEPKQEDKSAQDSVAAIDSQVSVNNSRKLAELSTDLSNAELAINRLNSKISHLEDLQENLIHKLDALNKNYDSSMVYVLEYINKQKQLEKAAELKAQAEKVVPKPEYTYYIKATVDGRAWLVRKDTQVNITVKVGDVVPTYGSIKSIDSSGIIKTSSGRVITLSPMDN